MTDEEVHAISLVLSKNENIAELNLQGNLITDIGCQHISSILSVSTCVEYLNLRSNKISKKGIKVIVGGLERNDRVNHIEVDNNGIIRVIGLSNTTECQEKNESFSSIICIVDVGHNLIPEDSDEMKEEMLGLPFA